MKKKIISILFLLIVSMPAFAFAETPPYDLPPSGTERITDYNIEMYLQKDGSVDVTEDIVYQIGSSVQRHGIYRNIPIIYRLKKGNRRQSISDISVTDKAGNKLETKIEGFNTKTIRIGDPDKLIGAGDHGYRIKYKMQRAINWKDDKDVFLWNFIGDGWNFPILNAQAKVHLPEGIESTGTNCFVGAVGSDEKCSGITNQGNTIVFSQSKLNMHRAFTGQIDFASGTFAKPSALEMFIWNFPWYIILPIIVFALFFPIWYKRGRDPKGKVVIAQYDPPSGVEPVELGYLTGETMTNRNISSQIIFLAIQGYLRIKRLETEEVFGLGKKDDYELTKLKEPESGMKQYNKLLLKALFKDGNVIKISDLKDSFAQDAQKVKSAIYKDVLSQGIYIGNPVWVRVIYFLIAGLILVPGILLSIYLAPPIYGWVSLIAPSVIAGIFAFFMPSRSQKGAEIRNHLLGLKEYIRYAEADRIKFHNEPKKDPAKFEELLPYAMGFKLEEEWAKQFVDIYKQEPSWFVGGYASFNATSFTNDLNSFSGSTASTFSAASSGGGAGSGGGGGGGGGW